MPTLEHTYSPRGAAARIFTCRDPEVLLCGPSGTGKSRAVVEKLNLCALKYPGMSAVIVRKVHRTIMGSTLVEFNKAVKELKEAGGITYYGGGGEEPRQYRYANGSKITTMGMDDPDKIMSAEYDMVLVDEAVQLSLEDWQKAGSRLRATNMPYTQLLAACNPDSQFHWLYDRCLKGTTTMFNAKHEENPVYFNEDGTPTERGGPYIARLDSYSGTTYQRLRLGNWVTAEGAIYEEFDPSVHVINRFDIPADWTRYWTVDFGYVHPFVAQWWAEDPDGKLYLYRELFHTQRTVDLLAQQMLDQVVVNGVWNEPKPSRIITDHQAENRAQLDKCLRMASTPARKEVLNGIQAVQTRLRDKRLFLMRDSVVEIDQALVSTKKPTSTIEEIPGYIWDLGAGKVAKEAPRKLEDDGCDAMRYMVANRDLRKENRVRFV